MTSHAYEVALFAKFFPKDLSAILNRFTLHSESAREMHMREFLFETFDAERLPDFIPMRAHRDLLDPKSKWILSCYLKPESARVHPEATVRPWATCEVVGDPVTFASGLGYVRNAQIYKRGFVFRRGSLDIEVFQHEDADPVTGKPIPARVDALWEVEVKTATPVRNTKETPLSQSVDAVLEVQLFMKGLLDLRRQVLMTNRAHDKKKAPADNAYASNG